MNTSYYISQGFYRRITARIVLLLIFPFFAVISFGQAQENSHVLTNGNPGNAGLQRAVELVVMIGATLINGEETFGAGIIFGRANDLLYIVTANHVIRIGDSVAKNIQVKVKVRPNTFLEAKPMEHADAKLDVAVLAVENLSEYGIEFCKLPLNHLGNTASLKQGKAIYPVGNPNGVSWGIPVKSDAISMLAGDEITFQSSFIYGGHSGGALLTERGEIVGMINADEPPFGRAINFDKVLELLRSWDYPILLRPQEVEGAKTPLHVAAERGDVNEVQRLLRDCAKVDATALNYAAEFGSVEIMQLLLDALDEPDMSRILANAASSAIWHSKIGALTFLIEKGATIDLGHLNAAIERGIADIVSITLEHLAEYDLSLLRDSHDTYAPYVRDAVKRGDPKIVRILLEAGAVVDPTAKTVSRGSLYTAVERGDIEMVKVLLEYGANPSFGEPLREAVSIMYPNRFQRTDPPKEVYDRQIEIISLLLKKIKTLRGRCGTVFKWVVTQNNVRLAKRMLELGVDPDGKNGFELENVPRESPPLYAAINNNNLKMVQLLLDYGARPRAGELHLAISKKWFAAVKLLIDNGVVIMDMTLHIASKYGDISILKLLIEAGADLNLNAWYEDETPLHKAIEQNNVEAVKLLAEAGADVNRTGSWTVSPLQMASIAGLEKIAKILIRHGATLDNIYDDPRVLNNVAWDNHFENPDLALKLSKRSLEIEPHDPYSLHTLAEIYFQLKDLKASKARLDEARKYADESDPKLMSYIKDLAERIDKASKEVKKER